jgi:hypothetical protein
MADTYSFGIEEEYFIVDAETKAVQRRMPVAPCHGARLIRSHSGANP